MTIARMATLASKLRGGRMLLGGHRGNPDECPENTLASFNSAIGLGVDLIECDVHPSEQRGPAVIHDHLLARDTDARADVSCPRWASIEPETGAELHAAGKMIGVWTVDDAVSLAWSKALPANAIYTNRPREIRP